MSKVINSWREESAIYNMSDRMLSVNQFSRPSRCNHHLQSKVNTFIAKVYNFIFS
jgi:hypothetical protein